MFLLMLTGAAQAADLKFTLGATSFADGSTHTAVGASVRHYVSKRWAVEPELLSLWTQGHKDVVAWGNFTYDFRDRDKRVVPYWTGAPGIIYSKWPRFSNTEAAFGTGGGVRVWVSDKVFVSPQVRFGVADGIFAEATVSIGYRFR